VYDVVDGWNEPLDDVEAVEDLPDAARRYVDLVERELDVEVSLIGTGRERERALAR
jgi:adenylosuccinate synthase